MKSDPRHNARLVALGMMFRQLNDAEYIEEVKSLARDTLSEEQITGQNFEVSEKLLSELNLILYKHQKEIDEIIAECAPEWPLDKISKVDLTILRIAIAEILYSEDTPDKVVIDEAVEIAKEFGNDTSSKFINGVLGTVLDIKLEEIENKPNEIQESK